MFSGKFRSYSFLKIKTKEEDFEDKGSCTAGTLRSTLTIDQML
jgi:hypothetical protein